MYTEGHHRALCHMFASMRFGNFGPPHKVDCTKQLAAKLLFVEGPSQTNI